jgi:ABC-type multidrug transport system fused ATPase/permease subunit
MIEERSQISLKNVEFSIKKGEFVSIIGKFGCGKSSLFNAILGEMRSKGSSEVIVAGKIAYVSQKAWILNDTVRNNILFGSEYDSKRYNEVIHYCCLKPDLEILDLGDQTLIGERGCTLSGGQKARISLGRALYSNADIYLLDDILSAVDAHVGSFIFFETLSKYLKGKTVLLITHSLNLVKYTDKIIVIDNCSLVA